MKDSSVYIVSPPTLYIPTSGLSFCLISNNPAWQEQIVGMLERGLNKNQLTFFTNDHEFVDPKVWHWYWHVAQNCNLVICDVIHSSEHEVRMALGLLKLGSPVIFQIKSGDDEMAALLHAIGASYFETLEQLDETLEVILG